jgi:hypothetical protein
MDAIVNEIEVNGIKYVLKADIQKTEIVKNYIIVRTEKAGVHAGEVVNTHLDTTILKNARRLYYWDGAATLSQLAMEGVSKPENCKFPCEVTEIELLGTIERIPCTQVAVDSIKGVKIWKH